LLITYGNVLLPYPGDNDKYLLIHQTGEPNLGGLSTELFYSIIDITMDSGLGSVISKNNVAITDTLLWGISVCRHANGRDWWICVFKNNSDVVYKLLFTNTGITSVSSQNLGFLPVPNGVVAQNTFSPNGNMLISTTYDNPVDRNNSVILLGFDRCTGVFNTAVVIPVSTGTYLWGLAFSPSGQFVYTCTSNYIFQIDVNSLSVDTVAVYDGFCFPNNPWCTTFFNMYLAANGKIYITSGSGVQHIHEMNYPDSAGMACDVQQHAINLNGVWSFRAVPNHPNYYLGAADGTVCDSLGLNPVNETQILESTFGIKPNPSNGLLTVMYILPQGASGKLEVFNTGGQRVFEKHLSPWSTLQELELTFLPQGVYHAVITSGKSRVGKNIVIVR
jgi:hypothetical protein